MALSRLKSMRTSSGAEDRDGIQAWDLVAIAFGLRERACGPTGKVHGLP
jgi:hypothetical protein